MMMDLAPLRAAVKTLGPDDAAVLTGKEIEAMLAEIERGHAAERDLINIRTIVNVTPNRWAVPA